MSVHIERFNHTLNGVSKDENGKIIFIEGSLVGEEVEYQVKKKKRKYSLCTVTQIIKASEDRIEPKCPHSIINAPLSICGGCSLQFLDNEKQIEYKQNIVLEQLKHQLGDIQFTLIPPLHTQNYHYRYKARLGVRYDTTKKKLYLGFREKFSHFLVDMNQCPILANNITQSLFALRDLVQKLSCYRHIPQIEVASGYSFAKEQPNQDYQTAYIIRHLEDFNDEDLKLMEQFSTQYQVKIFSQRGKPSSIKKLFPVNQTVFLSYTTLDDQVQFDFFPTDFTQVNPSLNNLLLKTIFELIPMTQEDNVVDLFCGIGNFAVSLAHKVKSVIGVESDENMCMRARHNAQLNQLDNTEFIAGDLYNKDFFSDKTVIKQIKHKFPQIDLLILDPPRSGAEEVVQNMNQFSPKKILYISCNPATFVRDLEILKQLQYNIVHMGVMNMFPQTTHTECIAILSKSQE